MSVAVIGAGIVGLATAFELAASGADVTLYERGKPGQGQSGGESRIFRHAHDDPRLVALACEARGLWRAWERRFGTELLAADGVVLLGPAAETRLPLLQRAAVAARPLQAPEERLPLLAPWRGPALVDEDGGVIRATAAVAALSEALGERLVRDEVIAVEPDGTVRAAAATDRYDRVVICAGRETVRLSGLRLPVVESIHTRYAYRVRGEPPARLACLQDGRGAYGDPLPGNARYAVGAPGGYVAEALPGLDPEPVEARTCWVTELPWSPDAFAVWEHGAVLAVAGSNLFKHAPLLGRELARAALGDRLREELRPQARLGSAR
jgi:sarcosine oxidase